MSLSPTQRDACEAWGLPSDEVAELADGLARDLRTVCDATHALLSNDDREARCAHRVDVSVAHNGALTLLVVATWWPTGGGGDDLLELGYDVTWRRAPDARVDVDWFALVTDHGSILPTGESHFSYGSPEASVAVVRPCIGRLESAFAPHASALAAAIQRLRHNGGVWA